jgi:mannitol/fructose-specific phosphotransferase system IIA component (Ntr-type)
MLSYVLTNLAVVILRESGVMNYQPSFRTPLYPALPIGCMMLFALLVVKQGDASLGIAGGIMVFSILLYMRYGLRAKRETALQQLVGRMAKPDFEAAGLEAELREVVRTRDGLVEDAFDRAVAQAPTFLLPGSATLDELFDEAAKLASSATGADADALRDRLLERERASSTVIAPGVAVPHLVLPGAEGRFLVVIAKCEDGVPFAEAAADGGASDEPVRTAVFLFASEDRRGAHLRSLAMVAQTILAPGFAKRWLRARTPQQLRDIFLLARRIRAPK